MSGLLCLSNLSNFYVHCHLDDGTHNFQKFNKNKFDFKFVCFATMFDMAMITDYDHCQYSLVTNKTNFQGYTSAHETLTEHHFLSNVKKKVYRDFMYFDIPCLTLEFVHYLHTNNHGMFKRLRDIGHYKKRLSKKLSTADMSDIAKYEHYMITDDRYNGVIPYTYITNDHTANPGITSCVIKKNSLSLILQLLTALACAIMLSTISHLSHVPSVLRILLSKYDTFQWLPMRLANVCDHGDGSSTCSFTWSNNYLVHLLCKIGHWYLEAKSFVLVYQELTTKCLIDRACINSLISNIYQSMNCLPILSFMVNALDKFSCLLRLIVCLLHAVCITILSFVKDLQQW